MQATSGHRRSTSRREVLPSISGMERSLMPKGLSSWSSPTRRARAEPPDRDARPPGAEDTGSKVCKLMVMFNVKSLQLSAFSLQSLMADG